MDRGDIKMKLSVVIPTHPGHRRFTKPCVVHASALGAIDITILYDNKLKHSAGVQVLQIIYLQMMYAKWLIVFY